MATSPPRSKIGLPVPHCGESRLHGEVLVDEILTRLPAAAATHFRSVCRAWNEVLTSDHFVAAHATRAAAKRQPEILFFPPAEGSFTSFYTCSLTAGDEDSAPPNAARKLLTVRNLAAEYVVLVDIQRLAIEAGEHFTLDEVRDFVNRVRKNDRC
jgi:hypothetical protein